MLLYTTPEAVVKTIGVDIDDLEENFFVDSPLEISLRVALYEWLPNHSDLDIASIQTPTAAQQNLFDLLSLYCLYFVAGKALEAGLAFKLKETDSHANSYERFNVDFKAMSEKFIRNAATAKQMLLTALASTGVVAPVPQFTVVAPTFDPVTG